MGGGVRTRTGCLPLCLHLHDQKHQQPSEQRSLISGGQGSFVPTVAATSHVRAVPGLCASCLPGSRSAGRVDITVLRAEIDQINCKFPLEAAILQPELQNSSIRKIVPVQLSRLGDIPGASNCTIFPESSFSNVKAFVFLTKGYVCCWHGTLAFFPFHGPTQRWDVRSYSNCLVVLRQQT